MNTISKQFVVRFNSSDPIYFDNQEWRPIPGKDYIFGREKVNATTIILLQEDPDAENGVSRSSPISADRLVFVGITEQIRMTRFSAGYSAIMVPYTRKYLESELESYDNMTVNDQSNYVCDLYSAAGTLEQMDNTIFAEIMELDNDTDEDIEEVSRIREEVKEEIDRLVDDLGGHSLLREILIWN